MNVRSSASMLPRRPRNDLLQYEDLAESWWQPHGRLAMLHWIAKARAARIPHANRTGAVMIDLGCGAGLLAPHVRDKGYLHVGIDRSPSALVQAGAHGVVAVEGDVLLTPFGDGVADVVSAGEILEHVTDHATAIDAACRLLRPGGILVIDTIASTRLARLIAVGIAERIPGGAPPGIHDPRLFVDRRELVARCATHGVQLELNGLRPSLISMLGWLMHCRSEVRMIKTPYTGVLFQAVGKREA